MRRIDLDSTDSTQNEIRKQLEIADALDQPFLVTARRQTSGRGRLGRKWTGLDGHTLMWSMWVPVTLPANQISLVSLAAGVALHEWLDPILQTRLKWPNDLLGPDLRKIAGILCEAHWTHNQPRGVIVGVGLNVSWPGKKRPEDPSLAHAAALADYTSATYETQFADLEHPLRRLVYWIQQISDHGPDRLAAAFTRAMADVTRPVTLKLFERDHRVGYIEGVSASGKLCFRDLKTGKLIEVESGELSLEDAPMVEESTQ